MYYETEMHPPLRRSAGGALLFTLLFNARTRPDGARKTGPRARAIFRLWYRIKTHTHTDVQTPASCELHRNFAVPGAAQASGHALTLPEDAVRGPYHRGPRPRGLPRHQWVRDRRRKARKTRRRYAMPINDGFRPSPVWNRDLKISTPIVIHLDSRRSRKGAPFARTRTRPRGVNNGDTRRAGPALSLRDLRGVVYSAI